MGGHPARAGAAALASTPSGPGHTLSRTSSMGPPPVTSALDGPDAPEVVDLPPLPPPTSRARADARRVAGYLTVGAAASIAAGVIHACAVASHSEHRATVWVFVATAVVQLVWGAYAYARPSRGIAAIGVVVGGAALLGWGIA